MNLSEGSGIVLSLEAVSSMDFDGVDAIEKLLFIYRRQLVNIVIADVDVDRHGHLEQFDWFVRKNNAGRVFFTRDEYAFDETAEQLAVAKLKSLMAPSPTEGIYVTEVASASRV
eukprot:SRR837773.9902.p2 GENE.SRR837773.9902~~SRR837773.9902.p2  ORF type:complete len:114 (-),score=44.67 SRR837773.9902:22-363(-)